MAQHDFVIDNASRTSIRQDINAALPALASLSSGPEDPAIMYPYQIKVDTSPLPGSDAIVYIRKGTNDAWARWGYISTSTGALIPDSVAASASAAGIVELATNAEALTGTDTARAVTPDDLKYVLDNKSATTAAKGLVELATTAEAETGTDTERAITPADLVYALQRGQPIYSVATGTDTYAATMVPAIAGYQNGQHFFISFTNANTGASTLNINSKGAVALKKDGAAALVSGDIPAGHKGIVLYDAPNLILLNPKAQATGRVPQAVQATKTDAQSITSASFADVTGLSLNITPAASSSKIMLNFSVVLDVGSRASVRVVRDGNVLLQGDAAGSRFRSMAGSTSGGAASGVDTVSFTYLDSPGTASAINYKIQVAGPDGLVVQVNRSSGDGDSASYARYASTLIAMEITA